jgi:photosystem II stability/assembly factor-like uncharacterized protein
VGVWPAAAQAHDASAWGGVFRSTDGGATWFQANQGRLIAGVLAIAVDPLDRHHLLVGTDEGLLATQNGGLDWESDLDAARPGPVFAVAVDRRRRGLAATASGLFRSDASGGLTWHAQPTPAGASPIRRLVGGEHEGRVYLLGWRGLFRSDDWGGQWTSIEAGLPDGSRASLVVARGPGQPKVLCLVDGQLWASTSGGQQWARAASTPADGHLQVLAADDLDPAVIWAAGAGRLFRSADGGDTWQAFGRPLPEVDTEVRGVAESPNHGRVVLSTDRSVDVSSDGGATWSMVTDNLPGHIEAGPLVRDPVELDTLYVGFALTPYAEQWRRAAEGGSGLGRLTPADVLGAAAFLALLGLTGGVALQWLARRRPGPTPASGDANATVASRSASAT